ncbi:MAG: cupin domain-containing protein [Kiloniellales bacterium]
MVDGVEHPIGPGTTVYVGPWRKHTFIDDGESDLKVFWVLAPG